MHVCDVNNFYSLRGGGVKTYHQHKLEFFLQKPEHEYTLVYGGEEETSEELSAQVRVLSIPGIRMSDNYRFVIDAVRLRRLLGALRPDVVELGEPYFLPWVARLASVGRPWPLIGFWHADFPRVYVERPISRVSPRAGRICGEVAWWYARRTYGPLTAVFASSATMAATLSSKGLGPVHETPLAVDTGLFNPAKRDEELRRAVGADEETLVFIFPHRLTDEKGLTTALEAFTEISSQCAAVMVVAGAGPGEAEVREYASSHPAIHYLGYISDRELMSRWYASSDLVLSLCPFETFGFATVEAVACGCVVIGTSKGAVGEMVARSGAGVQVAFDDAHAIAATTLDLLHDRSRLDYFELSVRSTSSKNSVGTPPSCACSSAMV